MKQNRRNPEPDDNVPDDLDDETGDESSPRPDANVVDEIAAEAGVEQGEGEPVRTSVERVAARDQKRQELDPASSPDFEQRQRALDDDET
jgi:hypothetical protein